MSGRILIGDAREQLRTLPEQSVHTCVTSPPYFGLRDYGMVGQMGLEQTPDDYVAGMVDLFREVRRVLRDDGTLWLNLGDSYANDGKWGGHTGGKAAKALHGSPIGRNKKCTGLKPKDLIGIPWRVAFALQADGWYLRQDIIWNKPNPMPESVRDRCTKAHEYIFMLTKSPRYYYDHKITAEQAVTQSDKKWTDGGRDKQRGHGRRHAGFNGRYAEHLMTDGPPKTRNRRSVWTVAPKPFKEAHFATYPPELIEPCILAGCPRGGTLLDPFFGAGTTGLVAQANWRNWIGVELNPDYVDIATRRLLNAPAPLITRDLHAWLAATL